MSRRLAREMALKTLFQIDVGKIASQQAIENILEEEAAAAKSKDFFLTLVNGVVDNLTEIDEVLKKHLIEWDIKRIPNVDRNILRIAIFELIYLADIPQSVSINEAVEVAKVFGTEDSTKFINGVLDNISKTLSKE
ncbi:MAG: transcription antitermination factor NusB [Bacillota bacterium]|nr:transcription antitermination factor NusB [Bacillota bacterium]